MRSGSTSWRACAVLVGVVAAAFPMTTTTALGQHHDIICTGSSEWRGTWTGSTTWTFTGNVDFVTGAGSGRISEVFAGHAVDGRTGTLAFAERSTSDTSGNIDIKGHIVCSSGDLAESRGYARWVGTQRLDGSGDGTYSGRWREDKHQHGRCHTA